MAAERRPPAGDPIVVPFATAPADDGRSRGAPSAGAGRSGTAERDMARFGVALLPPFRAAQPGDATVLAHLINLAGEGLPMHLWRKAAGDDPAFEGCTPFEVGVARARRAEGGFSYTKAVVIEAETPESLHAVSPSAAAAPAREVAGMLLGMRQAVPYDAGEPSALPAPLRPLVALEAEAERLAAEAGAPGTWYLNALAVLPPHQGRGLGGRLLAQAEVLARAGGARFVSLIVDCDNRVAEALYRSRGYREVARRPISPWPNGPTADWALLLKAL